MLWRMCARAIACNTCSAWMLMGTVAILTTLTPSSPVSANYRTIHVHETANIERTHWPVQAGVPLRASANIDALQLVRVDADGDLHETPFQVLDEIEAEYDIEAEPLDPIKTVEIAFLANLPAGGSHEYRLYATVPEQDVVPIATADAPRLEIERGERLGRTIDTGAARFRFATDSGQLTSYQLAGVSHEPSFEPRERVRPVHGSADVAQGSIGGHRPFTWGNVRNWDIEDSEHRLEYREAAGPIAWRMVRTGHIPDSNETQVSLSYTIFAGSPYILESSEMRFTRNTAARAVRNNQLVFLRGYHTHGLYIDHDDRITTVLAYDHNEPNKRRRRMGVPPLPPDIPMIGMFHEDRGYGVGMVTMARANHIPGSLAANRDSGAFYYFLDSALFQDNPERSFFYFVRAEVAPGSYGESWPWRYTVIPAGAVFASQSAILPFGVERTAESGEARFSELEHSVKALRQPVKVSVE